MRISNQFKSKVKTYLVKRLGAFDYRRGWMRVPICPYCGRENKLGVNLSSYRSHCFRCGATPSPSQLIMDVEHIDTYTELTRYLNSGDFTELTFHEDTKVELAERLPVYLPEGFTIVNQGDSVLAKSIRRYLINRGFDIEELSKQGIGYCNKGDLFGYIIIPFHYRGELRYYNARNVMGVGPRYNNPSKDITGLGKEFIIFNQDALDMYKTIYLCEGAFNALTMGSHGIATMGKSISRYQLNLLIKSPVEHVIILLDPDAKNKAIDLAFKLINYKKVKVIFLPEGKDVNDIGKPSTMKLIYKGNYLTYNLLTSLKHEYC